MTNTHTHTQQNCKFCQRATEKRVCEPCIREHRPKMSTGWLIFWCLFGLLPAIIYYFIKKNKQDTWDRENL